MIGDAEAGERALAPFRALAEPIADMVQVQPYSAMFPPEEDGEEYHPKAVSRNLFMERVGPADAALIVDQLEASDASLRAVQLRVHGGAIARVPAEATAFAHRAARIMVNVGDPDRAFGIATLPTDGVGLARIEFIISSAIRVHPMALVHFDTLPASATKDDIAALTKNYSNRTDYFVEKLAEGVGRIAAAFYPKDVIVRLSDFKSNEYADLLGGRRYEPREENPMLGFRGASRYYDPRYRDGFALECQAMRQVREAMGLWRPTTA